MVSYPDLKCFRGRRFADTVRTRVYLEEGVVCSAEFPSILSDPNEFLHLVDQDVLEDALSHHMSDTRK